MSHVSAQRVLIFHYYIFQNYSELYLLENDEKEMK